MEYLLLVSSYSLQTREKYTNLRQTKLSQFVYFSLILIEREEAKTKYSATTSISESTVFSLMWSVEPLEENHDMV